MSALASQLARALESIERDDPRFGDELRALADLALPDLVLAPDSLAGQLSALFMGLRRLRPLPVWSRGELAEALSVRDAYGLEGALIEAPLPEERSEIVRGRGREVYWRVGAMEPDALSARLPAGVGVVLDGPGLSELPSLRRALRGRAVGIAISAHELAEYADARLDLVVLAPGSPADAGALAAELGVAARALRWAEGRVERSSLGVIVPAQHAATTALCLTGHRTRGA